MITIKAQTFRGVMTVECPVCGTTDQSNVTDDDLWFCERLDTIEMLGTNAAGNEVALHKCCSCQTPIQIEWDSTNPREIHFTEALAMCVYGSGETVSTRNLTLSSTIWDSRKAAMQVTVSIEGEIIVKGWVEHAAQYEFQRLVQKEVAALPTRGQLILKTDFNQ